MKDDFEIGLDAIRARARPAPADGGDQVSVRDVTPNTGRTGGFSIFDSGGSFRVLDAPAAAPAGPDPTQKGSWTSDAVGLMQLGAKDLGIGLRWALTKTIGKDAVDWMTSNLGGRSEEALQGERAEIERGLSGATRAAMKKEFVTEKDDGKGGTDYSAGEAWSDPRSYFALIMQSVPGTVASMGPSFAIARAAGTRVLQSQLARGATQEAAKKAAGEAAQRAALIAGGASEGGISGAQTGQQVEQEILRLPTEVLRTSEAFQELVKLNGGDENVARQKLASDRAWRGALMAGVATAAFGGQGDRILQKILGGEIKGFFRKVGAGALAEGFFEEWPQSVGEQVSRNVAVGAADPRVTLGQGVPNAGVSGLVAGAGMGAGFAAGAAPFADRTPERRETEPQTGDQLVPGAPQTGRAPDYSPERDPRAPRTPDPDESMPPPPPAPTGLPTGELGQSDPYADDGMPRDRGGEPPAPPPTEPMPTRAPRTPDPDETLGAPQWDQVETRPGSAILRSDAAPVSREAYVDDQMPRARGPVYTPQMGDIAGIGGRPFMSRAVAESRAKSTGGTVIDHPDGGFIVRPGAGEQIQTSPNLPNPPTDGPTDLPPDEGGGPPGEPPAGTGGGGAAAPESNPDVQAAIDEIGQILGVDSAANEAATSPTNDRPEPTDAQKEAGNYKKGHTKIGGLPLAIENPAGTRRRPEWPELPAHYGYVKGTTGKDGDQVDVFVKPGTSDEYAGDVYVIDQQKEKGGFDEHKVMIGYGSQDEAVAAYKSAYTPEWEVGPVTPLAWDSFKQWVDAGDHTKPIAAQMRKAQSAAFAPPKPADEHPAGWYGDWEHPLRFMSGMSRIPDFTAGLAAGKNVGIDIGELSKRGAVELGKAMADSTGYLFVDSGAFSVFRANLRAMKAGKFTMAEFGSEGLELDFDTIMDLYETLGRELGRQSGGDDAPAARTFFVMPDIVGDQAGSIELAKRYADDIKGFSVRGIVPIQLGPLSPVEAFDQLRSNVGSETLLLGIPSNEKAFPLDDLRTLIEQRGDFIDGVHFLGAASQKTLGPKLAVLGELGYDGNVSADANVLRSLMYGETDRATALRKLTAAPQSKIAAEVQAAKEKPVDVGGRKPFVDGANSLADRALDVKTAMKKKQTLAGEKADHQQRVELRDGYEILRAQLLGTLSDYEEAFGKEARATLEATPKVKDALDRSDVISVGRQDNIAAAKKLKKHDTVKWYSPHTYTVDGKTQKGRWFSGTITSIDRNDGTVMVNDAGVSSTHGAAGLELVESKPPVGITKPAKSEPQAPKGVTGEPLSEAQLVSEATAFIEDLFATGEAPERASEAYTLYEKMIGPERKAGWESETKLSFGWFLDIFNKTQKNPPAKKSAIAAEVKATKGKLIPTRGPDGRVQYVTEPVTEPKSIIAGEVQAAKDKEAMAQAKAEAAQAIDELASILGVKKNVTPEQRAQLLPVLSKLMGALLKMGYLEFKAAARKALELMRAKLAPEVMSGISAVDLRSAYNIVAQDYKGTTPEDEVAKFKTIEEIVREDGPAADVGERAFVDAVKKRFADGKGFASIVDARALFEQTTGREAAGADQKRADELVELAIVEKAREIVSKNEGPKSTYDALVRLYGMQPNLGTRTSTSVEQQAYSTPAPLAFLTGWLANLSAAKSAYGPTAGNGMLTIGAKPSVFVVNELNPKRNIALSTQGFKQVTQHDASEWTPEGGNFDVIIENPPFGVVKDAAGNSRKFEIPLPGGKSFDTTEIDHAIVFKALEKLKDDGTAAFIVGSIPKTVTGEAARGDAYNGSAKRRFYYALYKQYNVVDHFTVAGELYAKQGAAWPVDVILIKGRGESTLPLPAQKPPRIYDTWDGLKGLLDANRLDASEPGPVRGPAGGAPGAAGDQPGVVSGGTGSATPGDRPAGTGPASGGGPAVSRPGGGGSAAGPRTGGAPPAGGPAADGGGAAGAAGSAGPAASGTAQGGTQFAGGGSSTAAGPNGPGGSATPNSGNAAQGAVDETGTNAGQVTYHPQSGLKSLGTLVPVNQTESVRLALAALADRVGDIDQFVMRELQYKNLGELGDAFAAEQIDALALAIDSMHRGSGFIIGDQTGVGKGRVVAGIIKWSLLNGRVPIFTTEKPNLYGDMIRDLTDIGVDDIRPLMTNNNESIPIDAAAMDYFADHEDAVRSAKALGMKAPQMARKNLRPGLWMNSPVKDQNEATQAAILSAGAGLPALRSAGYNMIFTTYKQMDRDGAKSNGKKVPGAYTDEIRHDFIRRMATDNTVILDETHNAGGQKASRGPMQGESVGRGAFFRNLVDIARSVFYSSATYAKRTDVMDLYSKTDMRLAVDGNVAALPDAIEKGGVPLMQVVSSMLVQAGQYIRRERTFNGVRYDTEQVEVDKVASENLATTFKMIKDFDNLKAAAIDAIDDDVKGSGGVLDQDNSMGNAGATSTNFTSLMHNVVNQMLLALKAKAVIDYAVKSLQEGEKPVITLANTMGSFIQRYVTDFNLSPGDSVALSFRDVLIRYLKKARDVRIKHPDGTIEVHYLTDEELGPTALAQWKAAEKHIRNANGFDEMPISPIDYLHAELRKIKHPKKNRNITTGEITGRTHTVEYNANGMKYVARTGSETSAGSRRVLVSQFNEDKVDILILNQSGSTGLSLHAGAKFKNQQKRHMIILQPELNIDTHMQMLGRVHRTGQVVPPRFTQLAADIPSEIRPASVLAKKMAALSANTTANRKSALTASNVVDFMNEYGDQVAADLMRDMPDIHQALDKPLVEDTNGYDTDEALKKVTGRLPMLPLDEQKRVYDLLESNYKDYLAQKIALGENALEAQTLDLQSKTLERHTVFSGDPENDSPFAAGAYAEVLDVKRLGKPYSWDEVRTRVADFLTEHGVTGYTATDPLWRLSNAGMQWSRDLRSKISDEFTAYMTDLVAGMSDPDAIHATEARMRAAKNVFDRITSEIHPGGQYRLILSDGSSVMAVALGIKRKKGVKMPVAPGAWSVDFALADASRHVPINFSHIVVGSADAGARQLGVQVSSATHDPVTRESIEQLFAKGQREVREQRLMLTGNLLAAYGRLPKGQIVNYTNEDGAHLQGILLARGTDIKGLSKDMPVLLTAEQAARYFMLTKGGALDTEDGALRIFKEGGEYQLRAKLAKSEGGKYYLSPAIRAITGDWTSRANTMRVEIPQIKGVELFREINKIGQIVANQSRDIAVQVGGSPFKPDAEPKDVPAAAKMREPRRIGPTSEGAMRNIRSQAAAFMRNFPKAHQLEVEVVARAEDIQEDALRSFAGPGTAGIYSPGYGKVIIVAEMVQDAEHLNQTLLHEVVGHYGIEALLGTKFAGVVADVMRLAKAKGPVTGSERVGDADFATVESVRALYGNLPDAQIAREVLARMAESGVRPTFMEMLYAKIRSALRALGIVRKYTNADLKQMVIDAATYLRTGKIPPGAPGGGPRGFRAALASNMVMQGWASWTPERINRLLRTYGFSMDPRKTKAYAGLVNPDDFLKATNTAEGLKQIEAETGPLDPAELGKEIQPIFLDVEQVDGASSVGKMLRLVGHEGRHRMVALAAAGIKYVPVVYHVGTTENAAPMKSQFVTAQRFGKLEHERAMHGYLSGTLTPISYAYRDDLLAKFGRGAEVSFSKTADAPAASLVPQDRGAMRVAEAAVQQRRDLKSAAQGYWHRAQALVDPMRSLPDKQRFMVERYLALGEVDRAEKMAESIRTVFMDASLATGKQAMYYLTTRDAAPTVITDQVIRDKAVWIKGEISKVADAMLDRGMITEASREKYRDSYLPQLYLKHVLATETGTRAAGAGRKPSTQGYLKARQYRWTVGPDGDIVVKEVATGRTLTQDEVLSLGLIDDPGYLSVVAIAKPLRDMALLDWLAKISVNEQWAHPSSFVRWNGHRVTAHWLLAEAGRIKEQAKFYQGENHADALNLVERMERVAKEGIAVEKEATAEQLLLDYKQIPTTIRYGRLGGMWVRTEIYDDIMGIHDFIPADNTVVGSLFGYGGIGTKMTAWWKMMKVALNMPAQVRNMVSNGVLLQLSGVPFYRVPDYVIRAWREVATGHGTFYDIAKRYGVDAATFTSNELAAIDRDLLELNAKLRDLTTYEKMQEVMAPIAKWAGDRYQMTEAIFKTAKIMHMLEQAGWSEMPAGAAKSDLEANAAIEAHEWLFDYSLVSKELRYARNAPVGTPFITFTAKVLPKLVEVARHHPQRFLPWIALFASAPYIVAMMVGADDGEDIDKLTLSMQKFMQERGHVMVLPFRDAEGRWQVVDLGYFLPWSFYTDLAPLSMRTVRRTFEGDLAAAKDSLGDDWANTNVMSRVMGLLGGPIPDILVALKTGRDPFTGREIIPAGATGGQKLAAWANYAFDIAVPPMLSSRGTWSPMGTVTGAVSGEWDSAGKAVQAFRGDTNRFGEPRATPVQAGLGLFGVNTSSLDPEQTRATNVMQMRRDIEAVRLLMIQKLRNQSLSPDERKEILEEGTAEMQKRALKMQEYLQRSQLPPAMLTTKKTT